MRAFASGKEIIIPIGKHELPNIVHEADHALRALRGTSTYTGARTWGPNSIHQLIAPHAWRLPFERAWRNPNPSSA